MMVLHGFPLLGKRLQREIFWRSSLM